MSVRHTWTSTSTQNDSNSRKWNVVLRTATHSQLPHESRVNPIYETDIDLGGALTLWEEEQNLVWEQQHSHCEFLVLGSGIRLSWYGKRLENWSDALASSGLHGLFSSDGWITVVSNDVSSNTPNYNYKNTEMYILSNAVTLITFIFKCLSKNKTLKKSYCEIKCLLICLYIIISVWYLNSFSKREQL